MEENKVKIFWKPIDGEEFKELEHVGKVEGFDFEPSEEPINVQYDTTSETKEYSFSFDMTTHIRTDMSSERAEASTRAVSACRASTCLR